MTPDFDTLVVRLVSVGATISPTSHGWIVRAPGGMYWGSFTIEQLAEHVAELERDALDRLAHAGREL